MSLWRVKHTLTPFIEKALIALVFAYGVFAIYLASVRPLVVATTSDIRAIPPPVDLDVDLWARERNESFRYLYAMPRGWHLDDSDPSRVVMARTLPVLEGRRAGSRIVIEARPLGERGEIVNLAAEDLVGTRPALYDVTVHGRPGLFAARLDGRRLVEQTVYVESGEHALVFRGGDMDPAAFSAFISTVKFLPDLNTEEPEL